MSDSGNNEVTPFEEDDSRETHFTFDDGGVPPYIGIVWLGFMISFVTFMVIYALPDLRAWFER